MAIVSVFGVLRVCLLLMSNLAMYSAFINMCQKDCVLEIDTESTINNTSMSISDCYSTGVFPFGDNPAVHQLTPTKPIIDIIDDPRNICHGGYFVQGITIQWLPPADASIFALRGFQVRVTAMNYGNVGNYPVMCKNIIFSEDTVLHQPLNMHDTYKLDCLHDITLNQQFHIEVQSLPKSMPDAQDDNTDDYIYHSPSCNEMPQLCAHGELRDYIPPHPPIVTLFGYDNVKVAFTTFPSQYKVLRYRVTLHPVSGTTESKNIQIVSVCKDDKFYQTQFHDVKAGTYEAWVKADNCTDCLEISSFKFNVSEWRTQVSLIIGSNDVKVDFTEAVLDHNHNAGNYTVKLEGSSSLTTVVKESPAVFTNLASGTYKGSVKPTLCQSCEWVSSKNFVSLPEVSTVQPNGKLGTDLAVGLGAGAGIVLICVMLAMYIMKRKFFSASAPTNEDSRAILEPSICDSETFPPPPPPPLSYTYYEPTNEELSRRAYDNNRAATRDDTRSETIEGQSASVHSDGYTCQTDMLDFNTDETVDPVCLTGASYDHDPRCHAGNFDTDMQVYNDTLEFDHQQQVFSATFDPVYYPQVFDGNFDYQGNNDRTGNMCLDDNVTCNNTNEDNSGERHDSGLGADSISIDI